jgi:hypothetical protein
MSDKMGGLVKLGGNLEQPRDSKPSDWPAIGPSGPEGEAKGANQLLKQTPNQEGPMHTQDSGDMTPSVWGKDEFKVGQAKSDSTSVSIPYSVDCTTGQISPNVASQK